MSLAVPDGSHHRRAEVKGRQHFLPTVVSWLIGEGKARVKVLRSTDKWYGVTYREDKPTVEAAIAEKTASGLYPDRLWEAE